MSGFDHAQLRLIEQIYVDGDDPFAIPEDIIYMEVNEDAPQEEETHTEKSSAASEDRRRF